MYVLYIDEAQYGGAWIEEDFDLPLITSHSPSLLYILSGFKSTFIHLRYIAGGSTLALFDPVLESGPKSCTCSLVRLFLSFLRWISSVASQDVNVGADVGNRKARSTVLIGCQSPHCLSKYSHT